MNVKLGLIAPFALLAYRGVQADPPPSTSMQPNLLPQPVLMGGGNQNAATVGIAGVNVSRGVQVSGQVTTTLQPHVIPIDAKVGVTIQHDVGGK
jgi:hypothetical protein